MTIKMTAIESGSVFLGGLKNFQQDTVSSCWAAVIEGIADYFAIPLSQRRIHELAGIRYGEGGSVEVTVSLLKRLCQARVVELTDISALSFGKELKAGHPVLVFVASDEPDVGHVVVVRGLVVVGREGVVHAVVNEPSFGKDVSVLTNFSVLRRSIRMAWAVRK